MVAITNTQGEGGPARGPCFASRRGGGGWVVLLSDPACRRRGTLSRVWLWGGGASALREGGGAEHAVPPTRKSVRRGAVQYGVPWAYERGLRRPSRGVLAVRDAESALHPQGGGAPLGHPHPLQLGEAQRPSPPPRPTGLAQVSGSYKKAQGVVAIGWRQVGPHALRRPGHISPLFLLPPTASAVPRGHRHGGLPLPPTTLRPPSRRATTHGLAVPRR